MIIKYESLHRFCSDVFQTYGFSGEESRQITDVLIQADLFGIESHGVSRIRKYIDLLESRVIRRDAKPEVIKETALSAVVDAHSAMGQLGAVAAMKLAIGKAKQQGIGMVQLRGGNHYGIAGYYALMAAKENLIGISMTNTVAIMVPTFGAKAMLGSNPIAFAMPTGKQPFLYDGATTVVTRGKLELYHKLDQPLKPGWTVDETGRESLQADKILDNISGKRGGGILPVGGAGEEGAGYKGFGMGLLCEILTSVLGGGVFSSGKQDKGDTSQCFYAIDYGMFGNKQSIEKHLWELTEEIRHSEKAVGQDQIFVAGDKEFAAEKQRRRDGIPLNDKTAEELNRIGNEVGVPFEMAQGAVSMI